MGNCGIAVTQLNFAAFCPHFFLLVLMYGMTLYNAVFAFVPVESAVH